MSKPRAVTEWHDIIDPIAKRYELAAMFNQSVTHNTPSCEAKAKLLRKMASIIDTEIDRRVRALRTWRLFGLSITISHSEVKR